MTEMLNEMNGNRTFYAGRAVGKIGLAAGAILVVVVSCFIASESSRVDVQPDVRDYSPAAVESTKELCQRPFESSTGRSSM